MPTKWKVPFVLAAMLTAGSGTVSLAEDYDVLFRECYSDRNPEQVIAGCSAVIARGTVDPKDLATAHKNRANAYDDRGEYDLAFADYEQAVLINPQDADAFNSRGTTYTAFGNYERAIQDFDQAIKLNPSSPMAFSNRCFAKGVVGQLEQALADCNQALHIRQKNPGAFAARGFVHLRMKHYEAAIADYNAELKIAPGDPYSLFGRGIAKHLKGDLRGGDGDVVAAQSMKPDIADHMAKLGITVKNLQ